MAVVNRRSRLKFASVVASISLQLLRAGASPPADKVSGPEACAECHAQEIEVWKLTVHFKTLNELHRRPETRDMSAKLGLTGIKTESRCQDCHYLNKIVDNEKQVIAGISCESCHGAARDWLAGHGDYGKGITKATEPAAHRLARRAKAVADGMVNPEDLYALGTNCYGCHILNDEKLANVGGHSPASPGFNLLTWSQGEIRHNILHTDNKSNPEATLENKRRLFVVGCIVETEFSFRAVGRATEKAAYGIASAHRADAARKLLEKIQSLAPTAELAAIVDVARAAELRLNKGAALNAAADRIAALGREFATKVTGEQLAGIDAILPGRELYKGIPYQVAGAP
jgi:hypothetical protein